jgi:hypothetical protein
MSTAGAGFAAWPWRACCCRRRWFAGSLLWLLAACSGSHLEACGEARKLISERSGASRASQHAGASAAKPKAWRPAKRDSVAGAWRSLTFFMPDSIEGFRARMGRDGRDIDVGAPQPILTVRRSYANKEGVILDLELIDTGGSPRLRELFGRTRELARDNERAVFRALKVQGQRAFSQWLDASKSARTSVLVADRFLVNVDMKPINSPALGVAVAQKLDIPKLLELAASPLAPKAIMDAGAALAPDAASAEPAASDSEAASGGDEPAPAGAPP